MKSISHWMLLATLLAPGLSLAADAGADSKNKVVFVCEHGSAKSMIAAAYFNHLAEKSGSAYRAISRGMNPDAQLQAATRSGLAQDGIRTDDLQPRKVIPEDVGGAAQVVTIGIENEPDYMKSEKWQEWDGVPSVSADYPRARDDLLRRIEALLQKLNQH